MVVFILSMQFRASLNPDFLSSQSSHHWALTGPGHGVQFYRDDAERVQLVTDFLADGLKVGQPVVAILAPPRLGQVRQALIDRGFAVAAMADEGRLVLLDAKITLASVMNGQSPHAARFRAVIGAVLERAGGRRRVVRAYGEMVDLLWQDGQAPAALRLEQMWNALAGDYHFALLCGYAAENFTGNKHGIGFEDVCGQHRVVAPIEARARSDA